MRCRKTVTSPCPEFDEAEFRALYRRYLRPSLSVVAAFGVTARKKPDVALRVMSRLRADAATAPAAILTMFALAVAVLAFTVNLTVKVTSGPEPDDQIMSLASLEAIVVLVLGIGGIGVYVLQSTRQRCATMWKEAFEDALRS